MSNPSMPFDPPRAWPDRLGAWWQRQFPKLGPRLSSIETWAMRDELDTINIDRPVFIAGLPRSGTTVALEILASTPGFTTHRYADFPLLWTPYWWNWLRARLPLKDAPPTERAHADRILVTRNSPEAFEEPLWSHFFPHLHQERESEVLDRTVNNPAFNAFFVDHLKKLLLVRNAKRYVSKGNYNLLRLAFLSKLFPDARFVIPIRDPNTHVQSLLKQDRLFGRANAALMRQIAQAGHHEFGAWKRVSHLGDQATFDQIKLDFASGRAAMAWLRIWLMQYSWLLKQLQQDHALAKQSFILPYEALCGSPELQLNLLFNHCGVAIHDRTPILCKWQPLLTEPTTTQSLVFDDENADLLRDAKTIYQQLTSI